MKTKLRLMDPDEAEAENSPEYQTGAVLARLIVNMHRIYGESAVATGALTAAAMLIIGREIRRDDTEVVAACADFVKALDACRDILREDATWMAQQPKGVM